MAKYASHRGPWPWEPVETHIEFWSRDVAYERSCLDAATSARDPRLIRLARKRLAEAQANLSAALARREIESGVRCVACGGDLVDDVGCALCGDSNDLEIAA